MKNVLLKNGKTLFITEAASPDASELLAYLQRVTGETDMLAAGPGEMGLTVEAEEAYIETMAKNEHSVLLCARVEGQVTAVASLVGGGRPRIHHTAELGISVKKAYWGLGIGNAMMAALMDYARGRPALKYIHLAVRMDNKTAFRLYRKYGFSACGLRRKFLKIGESYYDELLMECILEEEAPAQK